MSALRFPLADAPDDVSHEKGRLLFAGEHTDSFYSYQGFMEGALLSGARAADQIWRARR